ncbi:hypothetical protein T02_8802 [Trichinella nativa]|uniref:Uncharacterized protein n=1 Tax=Trichinella nativa TaxID=6335 RepID=A0A0V1KRF7_9BILA|nr:hypothetical protein T06_6042 [Trichinella sp. T6]KRZ49882.1 hypothetical protein T02_8802 [Trichinella nativa]
MQSIHDSQYADYLGERRTLARAYRFVTTFVEQPCANAGHDRGIPPAASRRGHPLTARKDLVRESVRPGPDQLLH